MKIETKNKQDEAQNASAVRDCLTRLVGRLVPIKGVPEDVAELHPIMHGGEHDFIWAWVPDKAMGGALDKKATQVARAKYPACYFRPPTWADDRIYPLRIQIGVRSKKWRWFWIYPPNNEE